MMKHTKHKLFFAWQYEKEEQWLNKMSERGLQLVRVGFCKYVFEENRQDQYIYRLEFLKGLPSSSESISYIHFLEETGVEYVDSLLRWAYFRKKAYEGEFELYSDIDSKIKHYKRILLLLLVITPNSILSVFNMYRLYMTYNILKYGIFTAFVSLLAILVVIGIFKISMEIKRLKKEQYIKE